MWDINPDRDFLRSMWLCLRPYVSGKLEIVLKTEVNPDGKKKMNI